MSSKILCVDDDKDILELLSLTLSRAGFEVATISKPKEAVAYAAKIKPDLILLDIMMPELSGYYVCVALREHSETLEVPVIFLTAVDHPYTDKMRALSLGAVDFVSKPFGKDQLIAVIKHHLAQKT